LFIVNYSFKINKSYKLYNFYINKNKIVALKRKKKQKQEQGKRVREKL